MCGICGILDLKKEKRIKKGSVIQMISKLLHRGPDAVNHFYTGNMTFGFTRLSIIDLEGGIQPIFNEDNSIILVCNGEIFNFIELRKDLILKGHHFKTRTDVEVLIHLYEEYGFDFLNKLNGQFAFAIFDFKKNCLFCARDHFGIIPFFYSITNGFFIFASEIKAILAHPDIKKEIDLVALDQILTFPGLIGSRTMFKNIKSLENGHYMVIKNVNHIDDVEYWDVVYPKEGEVEYQWGEDFYMDRLDELITNSVKLRLRADVPVGLYISGGIDSTIVSAKTRDLTPSERRYSFSIDFEDKDKSESKFQRIAADYIKSNHSEKIFYHSDINDRLKKAVYHSEYPLKETYNTASLALSEAARAKNIKVVLSGEGADEWFAGYPGYKFDKFNRMVRKKKNDSPGLSDLNKRIWGDETFNFEMNLTNVRKMKKELYSKSLVDHFDEDIDCLKYKIVNKHRLQGLNLIHKRSYLDYKLRLVNHLIADHGDRMAYANSVEVRYPFLDKDLVEFMSTVPADLKLKEFEEKYLLKKVAKGIIPECIIHREKFAFHSSGSPQLLKRNLEYINDLINYEKIKHQGFFNPETIEKLKKEYTAENFHLNIPYEMDLLIIVITFGIFLNEFEIL